MKIASTLLLLSTIVVGAEKVIVKSLTDDLQYDENGKLASHHLFYPGGNKDCPAVTFNKDVYGFTFQPLYGKALEAVFPNYDVKSGNCPVACAERGVDKSLVHAIMPHKRNDDSTANNFDDWFEYHCRRVELCLMNYHDRETPIQLFWIDHSSGERKLHMEIEFGEQQTRCFHSFLGHEFEVHDGKTNQILDKFIVEYTLSTAFGESPPSGNADGIDFDQEIESTLHHEWYKTNQVHRTFSPLGFKKARLPDDVFASIGSFYYNNRNNDVREEWDGKGVFVNWWESDVYFIQVPWNLKGLWQDRLRLLVEAWAGVPVEQTDMYGLRQYVEGARLLTHVDRQTTHAVSLILNIAQSNLTEPWPVEVYDHAHRLHEVIMEPGDIVYYESAKALHGRNRPLAGHGAKYINIFTHYRPTGDPEWMNKPNTPGTPEPILEVEGECKLQPVGISQLPNKQLGYVETVKCDDKRLEATISPSLTSVKSGDDLIDWWRMTGANRKSAQSATE